MMMMMIVRVTGLKQNKDRGERGRTSDERKRGIIADHKTIESQSERLETGIARQSRKEKTQKLFRSADKIPRIDFLDVLLIYVDNLFDGYGHIVFDEEVYSRILFCSLTFLYDSL